MDAVEECIHGMAIEWCGVCTKARDSISTARNGLEAPHGGETKQAVLNDITDLLRLPRQGVSVGSSLPSDVFAEAARQAGVRNGSMPEVCEMIVRKAGLEYSPTFDSRGSVSGGGSTVTLEGIQAMRKALGSLLRR